MPTDTNENRKKISIDLPVKLVDRFDALKREWGLRRRGAVLERLLEEILSKFNLLPEMVDYLHKSFFDGADIYG